ncbi:L,D-transpeptidase family protein [Massilia sp. PAMC28688]|uniref:L,D-transpeptidase family protein n=1 Tax=Massilia sp. PAMC28688 TaxID=2861283 RepID=UPI001C633B11|nr:L,D-transpeptidase family protein [Massilia sp. PAMC28688]QYF93481.1 L,D-transpeptidase family protein [Massilia sp. PAMC28688]
MITYGDASPGGEHTSEDTMTYPGLLFLALLLGTAHASSPRATRVMVDKSDRLMQVFAGDKVIATYAIGLGTAPVGHKLREGDRRTPEGRYRLDFKKRDSTFFRAIHISYPNAADRARAREAGVSPGGDIMIHGESNDPAQREAIRRRPSRDYTYGCIALSNADMQRFWDQVSVPIPIDIVP